MPSIQTHVMEFWFRRLNVFGRKVDPIRMRAQSDRVPWMTSPTRGVRVLDVQANSVHAELLVPEGAPQDRAILYIHGGAWFLGSARMYRRFVSHLALESGVRALVIDYSLAPEKPFPAGLEDCLAGYDWLVQSGISPEKIIVAGDSAGGNLSLALLVALRERAKPLPAAVVAISPVVDLTEGKPRGRNAHLDPIFSKMKASSFIDDYLNGHDPCDPLISPVYAELRGLPPLYMQAGEYEVLLDGIERFYQRAVEAGVDVKLDVWPQMFHVFEMWTFIPEARAANRQIAEFIRSKIVD